VHPDYRSQGIGFVLKRAQWQMVRHQGIDRITWTYDPLLSRNAHLNIARLGAVCNVYLPNYYGEMRDGLNTGLPSDRFQVDWWVNGDRARRRLSRQARTPLKLDDFLQAEVATINPTQLNSSGFPKPGGIVSPTDDPHCHPLALAEIPADFQALKAADPALAAAWRQHSRDLFETYFAAGFLVTDLLYQPGAPDRSFYVLTHGESTL
jgi:predicted GNAT superfamily acetyltransferase